MSHSTQSTRLAVQNTLPRFGTDGVRINRDGVRINRDGVRIN